MAEFVLPRNLADAAAADTTDAMRAWVAALPDLVDERARDWSLILGRPFQPGGVTAWVAPACTARGDRVVLKIGMRHDEGLHEADGLRAWDGHGAVRLLRAVIDDTTAVLLLEACEPGASLSERPQDEQDVVVARLLRRLWIDPPAAHPFRPLESMCARWADELDAGHACAAGLDPGLVRAGVEAFRSLPASAAARVVLATDLHAGNVLSATRADWLAIDPKPYVGDPTYDVLQHMLNCPERLHTGPGGLTRRMAELAGLDAERLRLWLFARCVVESVSQPHLAEVAAALAP